MKGALVKSIALMKLWLIPVIVTLSYIVISTIEIPIFPDVLEMRKININELLSVVIGATASILGIWVAVTLLSFELVKHRMFKKKGDDIFEHPSIANFLSLGVMTIVFSIISYIRIKNAETAIEVTVGYFIVFLFIVFVLGVFPAMKNLLYSTSSFRKVLKSIDELKSEDFKSSNLGMNSVSLFEDRNTTLFNIRAELIASVGAGDFEASNQILAKLNGKVFFLIADGQNRTEMNEIFSTVSFIWKSGVKEAVRAGNYQYLDSIWESILSYYAWAAEHKHEILHYQAIDLFTRDYIEFLGKHKLGDNLSTGVRVLSSSFEFNLQWNSPKQELIYDLFDRYEKDGAMGLSVSSGLQWDHICELLSLVFDIQHTSITNNDRDLFEVCRRETDVLLSRIQYGELPLEELKHAYLVEKIVESQIYSAEQAMEQKLFNNFWRVYDMHYRFILDSIENDTVFVKYLLQLNSDFLIKSQRNFWLEAHSFLHEWGVLPRLISKFYGKNDISKNAMTFIISTFELLKREIELSGLQKSGANYTRIKESLDALRKTLQAEHGEKAAEHIKMINSILQSFAVVEPLEEFGLVKWPKN